jgi:polyferredoxin
MGWAIGLYAVIALVMAGATALLVRLSVEARRRSQVWVALFLLAMMGEMWIAPLVYLAAPSTHALVEGVAVSGAVMTATFAPLLLAMFRGEPAVAVGPEVAARRLGLGVAAGIAAVILANEFLMGWTFQVATGTAFGALLSGGWLAAFARVVDSPWFLLTMGAEMLLSTLLLWGRLPRAVTAIFLAQSAIMVFSPTAFSIATWTALSIYVSSALMIGLFVFLFEYLYRHRQLSEALSRYWVELVGVYAVMMIGLFVWMYFAVAVVFAASIVLEMGVFYLALARPDGFGGPPAVPWQLRPNWAFALLSCVFVAELGMGAVLSLQLDPADYVGGYPFLPLSGAAGAVALNAVSNGFWFFATSAASSWFLIMMGFEMGALVVFKLRESKNPENRIRLALMLGSYAAFAVFFPSLYFALVFPSAPPPNAIPVLGWSMGIGSYPLAVGVFGTLLLTYVITGALTVLFGRRVICSVFCTAPLMYQGTTIDAMKSFNRSEPLGRKYLSSRLSGLYSGTTAAVMVALAGTSVLSYLDTTGATSIYIQGNDPSVFFFVLSFSVVWYVLFVSIPYVGNYNCVTMGWCYTGTIAQAFQKIGVFKLKVRDRRVCWECTTLDCAKGCPVGLVDMPGHFRQTGEFRSTKCCGVGDCVEACPYDNLYVSDIRHWVRRRLGRPETRPRRVGTPAAVARPSFPVGLGAVPAGAVLLPMAGDRRRPVVDPAASATGAA